MGIGKEDSSGRRSRKRRRKARSVATGVSVQRSFGASQKKCGYRLRSPDNAPCVQRNWECFKEECRKEGKLCEWTFERLREAYERVAMDDIGRLSVAQEISRTITDFLRRIIAPVDGMGGVTLSYVCSHCNCFPLDDYIWWVSTGHGDGNNRKKTHYHWLCAACGGQYEWRASNRMLLVQLGANANEAKAFNAHAALLGLCDNLINALKLLANQQKDGDSPMSKHCKMPARKKQKRHHERAKKIHPSRQSLCGGRG